MKTTEVHATHYELTEEECALAFRQYLSGEYLPGTLITCTQPMKLVVQHEAVEVPEIPLADLNVKVLEEQAAEKIREVEEAASAPLGMVTHRTLLQEEEKEEVLDAVAEPSSSPLNSGEPA